MQINLKEEVPQGSAMQHPPILPFRRLPKLGRRPRVLRRRRRRLPKRRSPLQLLKRGSVRSSDRRHEAASVGGNGDRKEKMEMEAENMKLYLENRCIMEENERLRKRALALRQENQILLSQLRHDHELVVVVVVGKDNSSNNHGAAE